MSISENIAAIRANMEAAALAAGRNPKDILLCAATKMNDAAAVREAIAAGVDCCGENRVQELVEKSSQHAYDGAPVHFIGHLQTNKVKQVVGKVDLIQSVDSIHLLEAINKEAEKQGIVQKILLEINVGNEESKTGFSFDEILPLVEQFGKYANTEAVGLMAIPPISQKDGDNRKYFQKLCNLSVDISRKKYDNVCIGILSMGMSDDYVDAIACGSTMVRVGTAIFGHRDYTKSHH